MKMEKNIDKLLIGLTGEYLVAGMMSLRGWVASLTLKNYPSVDIFGLDPKTNQNINVQVKTTKNAKSFQVSLMRSQRDKIDNKITCPFVFVYIDRKDEISYYVLSQKQLIQVIEKTDDEYYNRPRKEPLKDYPIAITLKDIADYKDKWDNLWI
jgi:penicillin-binding protein-related factor A (putative recombinase)